MPTRPSHRPWRTDALRVPLISTAALAFPVPLMLRQSFLEMGDVTAGSLALAAATTALPIALVVGLVQDMCWARPGARRVDAVALTLALQGWLVLAAWGLMPIRMWAI